MGIMSRGAPQANPGPRRFEDDPLGAAALVGDLQRVDSLLAAGARVDVVDAQGANLLIRVAEMGWLEIARSLIKAGAAANFGDPHGFTPMHYAIGAGSAAAPMFKLLMEHGADVDVRSATGLTPALYAASLGYSHAFSAIVALGANPLAQDRKGLNAFDLAIENERENMALWLLHTQSELRPSGEALDKRFVRAVRRGLTRVVNQLAEMGADVGQKPNGRTLLQCAPPNAEDLKRLLRSLKSGAAITSAMSGGDAAPRAPEPSATL